MKLAIMQPYFFPYIGYFQLMASVDEFVVYDNIEYSKGWINRNRILVNSKDSYVTIPLRKDSDFFDIKDRYLSDDWPTEKRKTLNRIREAYRKSPYFNSVYPIIEKSLEYNESNLFNFLYNCLVTVKEYLNISVPLIVSSSIAIDHKFKAAERVLNICKAKKAEIYLNPIGGVGLYSKEDFARHGIELQFLKSNDITYNQFNNEFVPFLSIIDVMMFNPEETVKEYLKSGYTLV